MGRRGALTLRGLRREIRERRDIWRRYEGQDRDHGTEISKAVAEISRARAEELEWADRLLLEFAKRVGAR